MGENLCEGLKPVVDAVHQWGAEHASKQYMISSDLLMKTHSRRSVTSSIGLAVINARRASVFVNNRVDREMVRGLAAMGSPQRLQA